MSTTTQNEARKIRASLKHPVIDADGHWAEFPPLIAPGVQAYRRRPFVAPVGNDQLLIQLVAATSVAADLRPPVR